MESIDQGPDQFLPSPLVTLTAELFLSGQEVFKYTHTRCSLSRTLPSLYTRWREKSGWWCGRRSKWQCPYKALINRFSGCDSSKLDQNKRFLPHAHSYKIFSSDYLIKKGEKRRQGQERRKGKGKEKENTWNLFWIWITINSIPALQPWSHCS